MTDKLKIQQSIITDNKLTYDLPYTGLTVIVRGPIGPIITRLIEVKGEEGMYRWTSDTVDEVDPDVLLCHFERATRYWGA